MIGKIRSYLYSKRRYLAVIIVAAAALGVIYYVAAHRAAETQEALTEDSLSDTPISVTVEVPKVRTISQTSRYIGTSEADRTVYIIPKTSGEVTARYFEEGDHVEAGELLFTIDDTVAKLTLEQAEAALKSAQAGLSAAEAGYRAQEAPNSAAHTAAEETLAELDTNSQQLQIASDSSEVQANQAGLAEGSATESYEFYIEQANSAWDRVDELLEKKGDADKALSEATSAAEEASESLAALKLVKIAHDNSTNETEKTAILNNAGVNTIAALNDRIEMATAAYQGAASMVTAAQTAYASASSAYESAKSAAEQLDLQVSSAENSLESARQSAQTAGDAAELSKQKKKDYDDYTQNTIRDQTNAQVVASDEQLNAAGAQVDISRSGIEQAQVGVDNAKLALDYCSVKSPISGVISSIAIEEHDMASPTQPAYTIIGDAQGRVVFYVAEKTMREIKVGSDVILEKDGKEHQGSVTFVSDVADMTKGLYRVEAQTTDGSDFKPNSSIDVKAVSRQAKDVLAVRMDCVYYDGDQAYVYVGDDGKAKRCDVTTGLSDGEYVEITDGLKETDRVITGWSSRLKDGSLITEDKAEDQK